MSKPIFRVKRTDTSDSADVISIRWRKETFVAQIRDAKGRTAAGIGKESIDAILDAAKKFFGPDPERKSWCRGGYVVESGDQCWYSRP